MRTDFAEPLFVAQNSTPEAPMWTPTDVKLFDTPELAQEYLDRMAQSAPTREAAQAAGASQVAPIGYAVQLESDGSWLRAGVNAGEWARWTTVEGERMVVDNRDTLAELCNTLHGAERAVIRIVVRV